MNEVPTESVEFEVNLPKPSPRSVILKIIAGVLIFGVVGLVAAVIINRTATPTGDLTTQVMPANVILHFSMTTHPDQQPNYSVVADAWKGSKEAKQIEAALSLALTSVGFDWKADIAPWLGDRVGVGLIDLGGYDQPAASTGDLPRFPSYRAPSFIVAAQTRDRAKSDAFLANLRKTLGASLGEFKDDVYRGVPIAYTAKDANASEVAFATVNDVVVATLGVDNLKKAIDAALDGTNLAASDTYKQTMSALPAQNVGAIYMDYGRYMDATLKMTEQVSNNTGEVFDNIYTEVYSHSNATPDPNVLKQIEESKRQREEARRTQAEQQQKLREMYRNMGGAGVGFVMTYEPGGIRFDTMEPSNPGMMLGQWAELARTSTVPPSNRIFDSIPASAIAVMNASNPGEGWKMLLDPEYLSLMFANTPGITGAEAADKIVQFQKLSGVDLKADVFDQFNGELAFAVLPKADQAAANPAMPYSFNVPFEIAAMFDSSDAAHISVSVDKMGGALLALAGDTGLKLQPMNRAPYTTLLDQDGNIMLTHGVVDGRWVIGSTPDTLDAIDTADQAPLSADADFKAAVSGLPANRLSTGYVRTGPLFDWYFRLLTSIGSFSGMPPVECGVCNYLKPIKWLSFADEPPADGLTRSVMHIALEAAK